MEQPETSCAVTTFCFTWRHSWRMSAPSQLHQFANKLFLQFDASFYTSVEVSFVENLFKFCETVQKVLILCHTAFGHENLRLFCQWFELHIILKPFGVYSTRTVALSFINIALSRQIRLWSPFSFRLLYPLKLKFSDWDIGILIEVDLLAKMRYCTSKSLYQVKLYWKIPIFTFWHFVSPIDSGRLRGWNSPMYVKITLASQV